MATAVQHILRENDNNSNNNCDNEYFRVISKITTNKIMSVEFFNKILSGLAQDSSLQKLNKIVQNTMKDDVDTISALNNRLQ